MGQEEQRRARQERFWTVRMLDRCFLAWLLSFQLICPCAACAGRYNCDADPVCRHSTGIERTNVYWLNQCGTSRFVLLIKEFYSHFSEGVSLFTGTLLNKRPLSFSGGQLQRIARALASSCGALSGATSSLDAIVQRSNTLLA